MFRLFKLAVLLSTLLALSLATAPAADSDRLANLSTRAPVGPGDQSAIVGFVVGPGGPKDVLIRAVGPTLGAFGVAGALADPQIALRDGNDALLYGNNDWSTPVIPAQPATAETFNRVGAFGLNPGTHDAALVARLNPGRYTAQVTGLASGTGIALVEVYDITGAARLLNLSTRARVGSGAGVMISGLVIAPGGGARKILIRAAGPGLKTFGVPDTLADPAIAVLDANAAQIAGNDDWEAENGAAITAAGAQSGAFPFAAGSKDAALLVDLPPDARYSVMVSGVGNTQGVALVEVYDLTREDLATVSVAAPVPVTDTVGAPPATVTFSRTGSTAAPLTVYYTLGGTAANGVDYERLPGALTIPAGAASASLVLRALPNVAGTETRKDVVVQLATGADYAIGAARAATATITVRPGTLYLAALRPASADTVSPGHGSASVQLSADGLFAVINLSLANLSSPATAIYLRLGSGADVGAEIRRLPAGQVSGFTWTIGGTGVYTAADIVAALKDGRLYVDVQTASYPGGELRGTLVQASGTTTFTPPPPAPALPTTALTAAEASRFLIQTTFGATRADIDALTGRTPAQLAAWIDAQIALPPSLHLAATDADFAAYVVGDTPRIAQSNRQAAWWKMAVTAPDQLRQRVAFALSEIFVVSDVNSTLSGQPRGMANYYDLLVRGAFGNFRELLENVTLSPVMGVYLSSLRNAKATLDKNGQPITSPDENYAREVMQLFTIGLHQLQPDGTLRLDATGAPIPTYDQKTITEVAKVFTGWSFAADTAVASNFRGAPSNYLQPMTVWPTYHDGGTKTVVGGRVLPAGQGGRQDLEDLLDALFQHPNTGPFITRRLIQRLVTSNPSPAYVYRVAQVFADNGQGVRGDLGAVVRAILLDHEARSPAVAATAGFGRLKEPLLRVSAVMRAFGAAANNGRIAYLNSENQAAQAALRSPTVFNFFEPDYAPPGLLANAGLFAPEFQILTDLTAITVPNMLWNLIYATRSATNAADATVGISLDRLLPLSPQPEALVAELNVLLAGGGLPPRITDRIVAALNAMPNPTGVLSNDIERVRTAIYLTVTVPHGAVQK